MQTKLTLASVAAMAYQANAVTSQLSATAAITPAESLISIYENCKVQITGLADSTYVTRDHLIQWRPSFTISGIDDNCPDMTAKIWFEPPTDCATTNGCNAEGHTVELGIDQVKNGDYTTTEDLSDGIPGDWFVHVNVTPAHFDCAMAITDVCSGPINPPPPPCELTTMGIQNFRGAFAKNPDQPADYLGEDGSFHTLQWTLPSVWSCHNLCVSTSVVPINQIGDAEGWRTWDQVKTDVGNEVTQVLKGYTTYGSVMYHLAVVDCDDATKTPIMEAEYGPVDPPGPYCDVGGSLEITDVTADGDQLAVTTSWPNHETYPCRQYTLNAVLNNGDYVSEQELAFNDTQSYITKPTGVYPDLVFDNLPINVTSTVTVTGKWSASDKDPAYVYHVDAWKEFNPACNYAVFAPSLTFEIVEGKDINSHKLKLTETLAGAYGNYCPSFSGSVALTHDGQEHKDRTSHSLNDTEMASFKTTGDLSKPHTSVKKTYEVDFDDGKYCVTFTMTPDAQKDGMAATESSVPFCVDVVAPACELTSEATLSIANDKDAAMMTMTQTAKAEGNVWCDPTGYSYDYRWKENNMKNWTNALRDEDQPIRDQLEANATTQTSWTQEEQDYEFWTEFQVSYNHTKFQTQQNFTVPVSQAYVDFERWCRPKLASSPTIKLSEGLKIDVNFTDATTGYGNCTDMFAQIEVFQTDPKIADPIASSQLTGSDLPANQAMKSTSVTVPDQKGCYLVKITYGEADSVATEYIESTAEHCWNPVCELKSSAVQYTGKADADDQNSRELSFFYNATWGTYCTNMSAQICVQDFDKAGAQYCGDVMSVDTTGGKSVMNAPATVIQTDDFQYTHLQATLTVSDVGADPKSKSVSSATDGEVPKTTTCTSGSASGAFVLDGEFTTDDLSTVTILGSMTGGAGKLCGPVTYKFDSPDGTEGEYRTKASKTWTLPSVTGEYTLTGTAKFGYSEDTVSLTKKLSWEQGCQVQITEVTGKAVRADADLQRPASIEITSFGTKVGFCGSVTTITASLTGDDGSTQSVTVNSDDFFSADGAVTNLTVGRDAQTYVWHLTVNAGQAPTIEYHQGLTTGEGWIQVLSDSTQNQGECTDVDPSPCDFKVMVEDPVCNVVVDSVDITGFREKSDCTENMIATITGTLHTEVSCKDVTANLKLKSAQTGTFVGNAVPTLVMTDDSTRHVYTFTAEIEGPNTYGQYSASCSGYDKSNEADKSIKVSEDNLWEPPCYLSIPSFTKVSQQTSLDGLRTDLSYAVRLGQCGSNACRDSTAKISMEDGTGKKTFVHFLSKEDTETAIEDGFNYTVSVDTVGGIGAVVDWSDPRAVDDQKAAADGWVDTDPTVCQVNVVDFCLDDAKEISAGRWGFEFTIRAEANSKCGAISADLDLIFEDSTYLGHVTIPDNAIVDAFNCDCAKTFVVEADFAGSPGEVFGQLDVRNSAHQVVQITDSGTYTIAAATSS